MTFQCASTEYLFLDETAFKKLVCPPRSSKHPREIMGEIVQTLQIHRVSFKQVTENFPRLMIFHAGPVHFLRLIRLCVSLSSVVLLAGKSRASAW